MKKLGYGIIVLMLLLTSCGDSSSTQPAQTDASTDTSAVTNDTAEVQYPYDAVDYGAETFTVLNCEDELWSGTFHVLDYEAESGDSIEDGIFRRARAAEERFNITFEVEKKEFGDLAPALSKSVLSGEDLYDAAYLPLSASPAPLLGENSINLYDIESLHLEDDWWHTVFIENATLFGDTLYAMPDFVNLMGYTRVATFVFNKDMFAQYDLDVPYDAVREGKWTVDMMREYMKLGVNLNGDSSFKESDKTVNAIYGFGAQHESDMAALMFGSGESLVVYDTDGSLKFRENLSGIESAYSKLADIFSTDGFVIMKNGDENSGDGSAADLFSDGRLLFRTVSLGVCADSFRDMPFEYGILPMPKNSEEQENYYSLISEYTLSLTVPKTAADPEMTGTVLNYMSYLGKTEIIPELQVALCYKGLRDEDSIDMMNIIMDSIYLDMAYIQGWTTDLVKSFAGGIVKNNLNVASQAEKQRNSIEKKIATAIERMTSRE